MASPTPEPPSPRGDLLRFSNCFVMTHTFDAPSAVFQPDYPDGTSPPQEGVTVASLRSFVCEQASTRNATVAPFHFAHFASVIDPPGASANGATETLAFHQFLTNAAPLADAAGELGLVIERVGNFSFGQDPAPGEYASPYELRVPADRPLYSFQGTSNAGGGSVPDHANLFLYGAALGGGVALVKIAFDSALANPSQPAESTFGAGSYWSEKSELDVYPTVNYQRRQASGNLTVEFLDTP